MAEEVKVFDTWASPYGLRVVWALKFKGIEFDTVFEDLKNKSPLLLEYNPVHKKVPVLVHNGKPICESLVILEYIEDTWKENSLLPQDPYERANARFWAKFNDDKVFPSIVDVYHTQGGDQKKKVVLALENLKFLEEQLKGKKFFSGEKIGFQDLVFGWMANLVNVLDEICGIKLIDKEKFPLILAWIENFSNAPIIQDNWPSREKLITKYQIMRDTLAAAAAAANK